jgi:hypothetical protein
VPPVPLSPAAPVPALPAEPPLPPGTPGVQLTFAVAPDPELHEISKASVASVANWMKQGRMPRPYVKSRAGRTGYLQTKVVTDGPASDAVKEPPFSGTAVWELRFALADVNHGVQEAGALPPAMLIGTDTVEVPLLMATTTTVLDPEYAERRTDAGGLPDMFNRT